MAITAKVKLQDKRTSYGEGDNRTEMLTFAPDYADGANREWAAATPWLNLTMGVKGTVADRLEAGKAYTLLFVSEDEGLEYTLTEAAPVAEAAPQE